MGQKGNVMKMKESLLKVFLGTIIDIMKELIRFTFRNPDNAKKKRKEKEIHVTDVQ